MEPDVGGSRRVRNAASGVRDDQARLGFGGGGLRQRGVDGRGEKRSGEQLAENVSSHRRGHLTSKRAQGFNGFQSSDKARPI